MSKIFVVYVTYPNSLKEYCYLCDIPGIVQGNTVMANNTQVKVIRTADSDPRATKYITAVWPSEDRNTRLRKSLIKEIESSMTLITRNLALLKDIL